jgi:3-deoxy-D-manno-octulosonate 8-phosphate phosphatase (KDO 8-P phosphatase)
MHALHPPAAAFRTLQERCAAIQLLVLDVDGVLTEGGIVHGSGGVELKTFHVRDGSGLKCWLKTGRQVALITGRTSPVIETRAAELGIEFVFQGAAEKLPVLKGLLERTGVQAGAVCCVGDDLPELPLLRHCGLAVAVADACPEARAAAHYITRTPGGRGAVREVIELMLRCLGEWQPHVEQLRGSAG